VKRLAGGWFRIRSAATFAATGPGPFGGTNLQTMSIAKAHLDDLVRQGSASPLWTTKGNS
jgi:hypothetical protein